MAITNLQARYAWSAGRDLPVVILMHGFADTSSSFAETALRRISDRGLFVVAPGMRGRDGASGSADASGRELFDIYDVLAEIDVLWPGKADTSRVGVSGYSGGGGNALGLAAKFPDTFAVVASHFGMSDYGHDPVDGWWQQTGRADLETMMGGDPTEVPDAYYARSAVDALVSNYTGGHIFLFHDDQDGSVPEVHTERVAALGMANVTASITTTTDDPRWIHGYPQVGNPGEPNIATEATWAAAILASTPWTIPASGTVTVLGYIVTKRFEVWLGGTTRAAAGAGLDEVATVAYDTTTDTYTVTPLTGPTDVFIQQGAKTGTATAIESATSIVVT